MKILVYGAGNMGSMYAALLKESGQYVSILARGKRLAHIREHGIELENVVTGKRTTTRINAVERLAPEDAYDLVLVILPKNHVLEVLPILAENRHTPSVMFMGNNAAGPDEMVKALGRERVLLGFPGAAGIAKDHVIHYLIASAREQPTTMGEVDGQITTRIKEIAGAFKGAGFPVAICPNMDAWLKTHVAEISPTANALFMAGGDNLRLARTRDAIVLMLRAMREGYQVLHKLNISVTPSNHKIVEWLPEPLLLLIIKKMVKSETTSTKIGHALSGRGEMKFIADEFRELAIKTSVPTPVIDRLYKYIDPKVEPVTDGSAEIPVNWSGMWIVLGALVGMVLMLILLL